jgi:hypothetical protein
MPTPSNALSTLRPDLSGSFMEFDLEMDSMGFIGTKVLVPVDVPKPTGTFGILPVEEMLKIRNTRRAPGAGYSRGEFKFETTTFTCEEHGAEEPVDDKEAEMYSEYFVAEQIAAMRARRAVLSNYEARVAAAVFNTSTWTGATLTTTVGTEWSNASSGKPVDDVNAAGNIMYENSGFYPNALVINRRVFRNLKNNAQVIDRITAAGAGQAAKPGEISAELLAQVFDVDYVIVGGATKNGANEGQTASLSAFWSNEYAMVCRIATSSDIREPCIGRTFHWAADGSSIGGTAEQYREEQTRSNIIRVRHDVDELIIMPAAGHLLSNITA